MATFILGLVILFVGAALYGKFCEKVFGPDDRETPAYSKQDGVDYIPMSLSLIHIYPVVQAIVVILALWVVLAGTAADLINQRIDPRLRLGGGA